MQQVLQILIEFQLNECKHNNGRYNLATSAMIYEVESAGANFKLHEPFQNWNHEECIRGIMYCRDFLVTAF